VLVATILAISRVSINPTPPQGRVPPVPASHCLSAPRRCCCLYAIDYRDRGERRIFWQPASATAVLPVSLPTALLAGCNWCCLAVSEQGEGAKRHWVNNGRAKPLKYQQVDRHWVT